MKSTLVMVVALPEILVTVNVFGGVVAPSSMSCEPKSHDVGLTERPATACAVTATPTTAATSTASRAAHRRHLFRANLCAPSFGPVPGGARENKTGPPSAH